MEISLLFPLSSLSAFRLDSSFYFSLSWYPSFAESRLPGRDKKWPRKRVINKTVPWQHRQTEQDLKIWQTVTSCTLKKRGRSSDRKCFFFRIRIRVNFFFFRNRATKNPSRYNMSCHTLTLLTVLQRKMPSVSQTTYRIIKWKWK